MKRSLALLVLLVTLAACRQQGVDVVERSAGENQQLATVPASTQREANASVIEAFQGRKSNIFVQGEGKVVKLLPDDNKGSRHQKFLVRISPEQTLLFAHNVDLSPRIPLEVNDTIEFRGEYIFNPKGGVMHWTHHDPKGLLKGGWVVHAGKRYE